jgi:hypothetical protein
MKYSQCTNTQGIPAEDIEGTSVIQKFFQNHAEDRICEGIDKAKHVKVTPEEKPCSEKVTRHCVLVLQT